MNLKTVNTIIFDLGGVLLNIDYNRTVNAFGNLGLPEPEKAFTKEYQADIFQLLEKGLITEKTFLTELRRTMPGISNDRLSEAWGALLGDFPEPRYNMLKRLSKNYRLFILSNTNIIHQKYFEKTIDTKFGWNNFKSCFEAICYSHEMGFRKPEPAIFKAIIDLYQLNPAETLFIDDTEIHTLGAMKMKMNVHHLKPEEEITVFFENW